LGINRNRRGSGLKLPYKKLFNCEKLRVAAKNFQSETRPYQAHDELTSDRMFQIVEKVNG